MQCFDDNQMAQFIDGQTGKARQEYIEHLNTCPECFEACCIVMDLIAENEESYAQLCRAFTEMAKK